MILCFLLASLLFLEGNDQRECKPHIVENKINILYHFQYLPAVFIQHTSTNMPKYIDFDFNTLSSIM